MSDIRVKVCGMTNLENVKQICKTEPDFIGFIFYPRSVRYVGKSPDPELFKAVPERIKKVAVFVNEYMEKMIELTGKYDIDYIQLHGMESPEVCKSLRIKGKKVIKVFPGDQLENERLLNDYISVADYFLFDTPIPSHGGSGRKFNWSNLNKLKSGKKYFLSGGISANDSKTLLGLDSPGLFAVDINSRFEVSPGVKDSVMVEQFIKELQNE